MDNFKKLIYERNEVVQECDRFIDEFTNQTYDQNFLELINLLKEKQNNYKILQYNNCQELALNIRELNDKIYHQIIMLSNLGKLERKSEIYIKYTKLYDSKQIQDFILKQINYIKKCHKSIITTLGLIPFIVYFIFGKNIGYFSLANSIGIVSILSALAISGISLFIILFLLPILHLIFLFTYSDKEKNKKYLYGIYILVLVVSVVLIIISCFYPELITIKFLNYYFLILMATIAMYYYIFHYRKNKKNDFELLFFMFSHGFFSFLNIFIILIIIYARINADFAIITILTIFAILFFLSSTVLITTKDLDLFKISFFSLIITNFSIIVMMSDKIIEVADLGNINYHFITLDKKALPSLPKEICVKDCEKYFCLNNNTYLKEDISVIAYVDKNLTVKYNKNNKTEIFQNISLECLKFVDKNGKTLNVEEKDLKFNNGVLNFKNGKIDKEEPSVTIKSMPQICMTYAQENNDTIKIYNVKILSALGKFYYLQTKSGDKFEVDSSLIISKQKLEDIKSLISN